MNNSQRFVKRAFDIVLSTIGLLVLWPVILICVFLARRDTGLSGVYVQERVGLFGCLIRVRKIRTMKDVLDLRSNTITTKDDVRITNLGAKFRKWKLDELPQLWNVFIGDMSLVGPRPDVPGYADGLIGDDRLVLSLRPGITGPATIKYQAEELLLSMVENAAEHNDNVIYPDKVRLNLDYLKNWTLITDIRYILITLKVLPVPVELNIDFKEIAKNKDEKQ